MLMLLWSTLVVACLLSCAVAEAQIGEQECYGNSQTGVFHKRGNTVEFLTDGENFECNECTGERSYCTSNTTCHFLSSTTVNVFENGRRSETLPLHPSCSPLYLAYSYEEEEEEVIVHCRSIGPDFNPRYETMELLEDGSWSRQSPQPRIARGALSFANMSENSVIIGGVMGRGPQDMVVSIGADRRSVVVHFVPDTQEEGTIELSTWCDNIIGIHRSLPFDTFVLVRDFSLPQFIIDCEQSGQPRRYAVTMSLSVGTTESVVDLRHPTGEVSISSDYFLFQDTSQITLVNRSDPDSTRATKLFNDVVITATFLTNDWVLVEMPGVNRYVISTQPFVSSQALEGEYMLQNSVAFCPAGVCPAHELVGDRYLLLFVRNEINMAYLDRFQYDLQNLSSEPILVGRMLIKNFPTLCFSMEGELPPIPPVITTGTEHPATHKSNDSTEPVLIITISVVAVLAAITGVVFVVVIIVCCCRKKKKNCAPNYPLYCTESDVPKIIVSVPPTSESRSDQTETSESRADQTETRGLNSDEVKRKVTPEPPSSGYASKGNNSETSSLSEDTNHDRLYMQYV